MFEILFNFVIGIIAAFAQFLFGTWLGWLVIGLFICSIIFGWDIEPSSGSGGSSSGRSSTNNSSEGEPYIDASGAWRQPGEPYIDASGRWRKPD